MHCPKMDRVFAGEDGFSWMYLHQRDSHQLIENAVERILSKGSRGLITVCMAFQQKR